MQKKDILITNRNSKGRQYVFISYASKNEEEVFNKYVIPLYEQHNLNVYFDDDFYNRPRENWSKQMMDNMRDAALCMIFISKEYVCSYACMLETLTALTFKIPILKIRVNKLEQYENIEKNDISTSTIDAFKKIKNKLETLQKDDERKKYLSCYVDIEDYLEEGRIPLDKLSETFIDCISMIPGIYLNISNGIDKLITAINTEKKKSHNVFSEIGEIDFAADSESNDSTQEKSDQIESAKTAEDDSMTFEVIAPHKKGLFGFGFNADEIASIISKLKTFRNKLSDELEKPDPDSEKSYKIGEVLMSFVKEQLGQYDVLGFNAGTKINAFIRSYESNLLSVKKDIENGRKYLDDDGKNSLRQFVNEIDDLMKIISHGE